MEARTMSEHTEDETSTEKVSQTESSAGDGMHDGAVLDKDDILYTEGLTRTFGSLKAVDDVSIAVERGTITGLIGPNGAGKSTLFNLISGFYEPDKGTVYANESEVTGQSPHKIAEHGLVRTFQTPRKPEGMTVREAMLVGPHAQTGESILSLFTDPGTVRQEETRSLARAQRMLERFEIDHLETNLATDLSGGQMKLVELARAMMTDPDLLLLDEPVAGVNPTLTNKLESFIKQLNNDGVTFLIIEHEMSFIMGLADTIVVLDQGQVLGEGTPEAVQNDERVVDAYLGGPNA
jgi:ABC-type branched-subunit amino acid transport system ATPase component